MAFIIRGTTPQVTCNVAGIDLTQFSCFVSIGATNRPKFTVTDVATEFDGDNTAVTFGLTQEQTLSLHEGVTCVQLRAIKDGHAVASGEVELEVLPVILNEVINDG